MCQGLIEMIVTNIIWIGLAYGKSSVSWRRHISLLHLAFSVPFSQCVGSELEVQGAFWDAFWAVYWVEE